MISHKRGSGSLALFVIVLVAAVVSSFNVDAAFEAQSEVLWRVPYVSQAAFGVRMSSNTCNVVGPVAPHPWNSSESGSTPPKRKSSASVEVYFVVDCFNMSVLDAKSGRLRWVVQTFVDENLCVGQQHYATALDGGASVITATQNGYTKFDTMTGERLFTIPFPDVIQDFGTAIASADGRAIAFSGSNNVNIYSSSTGNMLWKHNYTAVGSLNGAGGDERGVFAFFVFAGNETMSAYVASSGKQLWSINIASRGAPSALKAAGSRVFAFWSSVAEVSCYDAQSGGKLLWTSVVPESASWFGFANRQIAGGARGVVVVPRLRSLNPDNLMDYVAFDTSTGKILWISSTSGPFPGQNYASTAVSCQISGAEFFFVSTGQAAVAFAAKTGKIASIYNFPSASQSNAAYPPAVASRLGNSLVALWSTSPDEETSLAALSF